MTKTLVPRTTWGQHSFLVFLAFPMKKHLSLFLATALIMTACSSATTGSQASIEVTGSGTPVAPGSAEEYLSAADRLPVTVAELNRSELFFINAGKTEGVDASTLDAGLRAIAAHATEVGLLGSELSATMAGQAEGEANADSYAAIARAGFVIALEAQNLRSSAANNPAAAVALIAEYGARLWNPSVTAEGVTGNPFLPHVHDPSAIDEVKLLTGTEAEQVTSQAGADREMRTWIALSTSTMTRFVDVPATIDPNVDAFNPSVTDKLTDSDGQKDHDRAVQVIAVHLHLLSADASDEGAQNLLVSRAYAAETKKKKDIDMPTGILPLDMYNFGKENAPAIQAAGKKFIPILTKEMKGMATTAKNNAIQNTAKAAEPEIVDFLKKSGVAIPTKNKTVPVKDTTSPVAITIVIDEAESLTAADTQKRGYNEGEKGVKFTVSWNTSNTSAFTISCNGQPVGEQNSAQANLNWPMKLGAQRITCVALGKGGAILGSNAVAVTLKETQMSSSGAGKSLGFEVSSASAPAVTAASSSAQAAVSSAAAASSAMAKSSSAFSIPAKSSAKASSQASSVQSSQAAAASSVAAASSAAGAVDTGWIEPYVKATEADLLARKFDPTGVAIVMADLRDCLYDQAGKGKKESEAKSACAAVLKAQSQSSTPADPGVQVLPIVSITATLSETIAGGPKTAFATQAVLTANYKTKAVTGTLTGSASWESTYYCYNTSDSSEIYQEVGARYTSTYTASVAAGLGADGGFSSPIKTAGTTSVKFTQQFTHEECTHLNGTSVVDRYSGNGTLSGTATTTSMWTITNSWVTDDGAVTVKSSYVGGPGSVAK